MSRDALAGFADLRPPGEEPASDYYPGSKQKRRAVAEPKDSWSDVPYVELTLDGVPTRFYYVGVLAEKLGRGTPAIRKWERLGYIPSSGYRSPGQAPEGQRRLYTRQQIEGLVRIAEQEGLLDTNIRNIAATGFPERARQLFEELKA